MENELLDSTELESQRTERQQSGQDTGEGASTSEIIASASDGGFATTAYRRVYQEYAEVAEEAIEREVVPGGYRFYVTRYFELISPRD